MRTTRICLFSLLRLLFSLFKSLLFCVIIIALQEALAFYGKRIPTTHVLRKVLSLSFF